MTSKFVKLVEELNSQPVFVVYAITGSYDPNTDESNQQLSSEPVCAGNTEEEAIQKAVANEGGEFGGWGEVDKVHGKTFRIGTNEYVLKTYTDDLAKRKLKIMGYLN
jgi:hypothetical protein